MSDKCPRCGHNPATDHLKMKHYLAQAKAENSRLRGLIREWAVRRGIYLEGPKYCRWEKAVAALQAEAAKGAKP